MTAILSSSVSCRTLVDGSLRLQVDIEPKDAQAAFALFGKPGSPVALALITNEAAVEHDRKAQAQPPAEPLERKTLSLASKVALTCSEPSFQLYLQHRFGVWREVVKDMAHAIGRPFADAEVAAEVTRRVIGVVSRREIREGEDAGRRWHDLYAQYMHWQRTGETA